MHNFQDQWHTILIVPALLLSVACPAGAENLKAQQSNLLERTEALLQAVEEGVLTDLKTEEDELRAEAASAESRAMGDAAREASIKARDEAMREQARELSAKIGNWATGGEDLIQSLSADELNQAMAEARGIAKYFGLDVEQLGQLYELGKDTIKRHEFVLPDVLPPDKDESYSRYFSDFFTFAHNREEELSRYRKEQQEYRLTLFKRVTLAYIRALLASTEPVPPCTKNEPTGTITLNEQRLKSFGCTDPVVDKLRAYVQAVQKIASADTDRFNAEAQVVLARQELTTDMAAGLPLVGDAMDFYNLYAGEDLVGRCLTRFDYGLTTIFAALPFLPSGWATQAVKRLGLEDHLSELILFMARSAEWSKEMISGVATRFGITPEHFTKLQEWGRWTEQILMTEIATMPSFPKGSQWLKDTAEKFGIPESTLHNTWKTLNKEITLPGGTYDNIFFETDGVISNTAAKNLNKPLDHNGVVIRNIEMAHEGQRLLRRMPAELREELLNRSRQILAKNLDEVPANRLARAGNPDEVIALSNMVPEHLKEFLVEARELDNVLMFRYVNASATAEIAANRGTKGMGVKGKSADWGPQAAFIPVDQNFSKLANPDAPQLSKIVEYGSKVKKCLDAGICKQTELILTNGDEVMIWKGVGGEIPIIKRGDKFYEHGTNKLLDVNPADTQPLMVLAEIHPQTGKLEPITADYDLLAVGSKLDVEVPHMHKIEGMRDQIERTAIDRLNKAGSERAGYKGGKLVHHGGETQNPFTPGAIDKDPLVTVADPEKGLLTIPICDRACMERWCETTGQCGGLPLCPTSNPTPPCMMVDPDRLLKDYFNEVRLRGYTTVRPNAGWDWGEYNGLTGWSPKVLMDTVGSVEEADWLFGQYVVKLGVKKIQRRMMNFMGILRARTLRQMALEATQKLFSCPGEPLPVNQ